MKNNLDELKNLEAKYSTSRNAEEKAALSDKIESLKKDISKEENKTEIIPIKEGPFRIDHTDDTGSGTIKLVNKSCRAVL